MSDKLLQQQQNLSKIPNIRYSIIYNLSTTLTTQKKRGHLSLFLYKYIYFKELLIFIFLAHLIMTQQQQK